MKTRMLSRNRILQSERAPGVAVVGEALGVAAEVGVEVEELVDHPWYILRPFLPKKEKSASPR